MNKAPKIRFKEFSDEWKSKKLGELGQSIIGLTYSPDDVVDNGTLVLRSSNIKNNKIVYTDNVFVNMQIQEKIMTRENDVLICSRNGSRGLIGKSALIDKSSANNAFGAFMTIFRAEQGKFIFQLLQSSKFFKQIHQNLGATINQITSKDLNSMQFYVPSIEEQDKIVSFFSLIDDKISLQGEKVEMLKDYKNGMIQKIFSRELRFKDDGRCYPEWEEKKLSELVIFTNGKAHENCIDEFGDYMVVNSKFISSDGNVVKLSNENLCPLKKDDIVMVMSDVPNGKALAKCYLINEDDKYTLNQRICGLRSTGADYKFLYYSINRNKYYLKFDNGVGQTNLRKDEVLECPILLPCKAEQVKIGNLLFDLDIKLEKEQEKLDCLNEYKKGLLQQIFA